MPVTKEISQRAFIKVYLRKSSNKQNGEINMGGGAIGGLLGRGGGGGGLGQGGGALQAAQGQQTAASNQNQAQVIGAQIQAERQRTQAQIHQIREETRTKITEMFRTTHLNRVKSSDKLQKGYLALVMS